MKGLLPFVVSSRGTGVVVLWSLNFFTLCFKSLILQLSLRHMRLNCVCCSVRVVLRPESRGRQQPRRLTATAAPGWPAPTPRAERFRSPQRSKPLSLLHLLLPPASEVQRRSRPPASSQPSSSSSLDSRTSIQRATTFGRDSPLESAPSSRDQAVANCALESRANWCLLSNFPSKLLVTAVPFSVRLRVCLRKRVPLALFSCPLKPSSLLEH